MPEQTTAEQPSADRAAVSNYHLAGDHGAAVA